MVLVLSKCSYETIPSIPGCTNRCQEMLFALCPRICHAVSFLFVMSGMKSIDNSNPGKWFESVVKRIKLGSNWVLCQLRTDGSYRNVFCPLHADHLSLDDYLAFPTSSGRPF